jgi:glycosyltransferase involved in cell wall biosynthesis
MKIGKNEEKFGMVLVEAMACQLPVIASDCVGPREIVEDGKTGTIIRQGDEDALKNAIDRLINSPELRSEYGERGRRTAEEKYSIKNVAKRWLQVLERTYN